MYMWTYTTEAIANQAYDTPVSEKIDGLRIDGKDYTFKNLLQAIHRWFLTDAR